MPSDDCFILEGGFLSLLNMFKGRVKGRRLLLLLAFEVGPDLVGKLLK
jgi:hypothetical protein